MNTPADPADLITWLRAEIDIDEDDANACLANVQTPGPAREWAEQIVLDVDAKRRILNLHALMWRDIGWLETDEDGSRDEAHEELEVCGYCVRKHSSFATRADVPTGPCLTVRLLAMPYAGRLGYRKEWKP